MARILLMTGLWVPVVGRAPTEGKALANRLAARYPRANLTWHSWWDKVDVIPLLDATPLVLIGHSFGASACITLAKDLEKRNKVIDEMLLLDPVPIRMKDRWTRKTIDVPDNVHSARCIARRVRLYPRSKLARGANATNETRSVGHDRFMSNPDIVAIIEGIVKRFA